MENNRSVFLVPGDDEFAFAIPERDDVSGFLNTETLHSTLPELWAGKVKVRLWPIQAVVADCVRHPDFAVDAGWGLSFEKAQITHLALVESEIVPEHSTGLRFGATEIKGNSMLVLYSGPLDLYHLLHCDMCAYIFAKWLEMKQPEWWDVEGTKFQDPRKALN